MKSKSHLPPSHTEILNTAVMKATAPLLGEIENLKDKLQSIEEKLKKSEQENLDIKSQMQPKIHELQEKNKLLESALAEKEKLVHTIENIKSQELKEVEQKLQDKTTILETQNQVLLTRIEGIEKAKEELRNNLTEKDKLLQKASTEQQEAAKKLQEKTTGMQILNTRNNELLTRIEEIEKDKKELRDDKEQLRTVIQDMRNSYELIIKQQGTKQQEEELEKELAQISQINIDIKESPPLPHNTNDTLNSEYINYVPTNNNNNTSILGVLNAEYES